MIRRLRTRLILLTAAGLFLASAILVAAINYINLRSLSAQTEEDMEEIRRQVKQVKAIRRTTQQGVFTRLLSPFDGNVTAWQFADETRVILCAYRVLNLPNGEPLRVRLHDVPKGLYKGPDGQTVSSSDLERAGVPLLFDHHDFASLVMVFERV
jgi:alpha-galactosidase